MFAGVVVCSRPGQRRLDAFYDKFAHGKLASAGGKRLGLMGNPTPGPVTR